MEISTTGRRELPTTQLPGRPADSLHSRQDAWLREMERQELQGWLGQPALPPHALTLGRLSPPAPASDRPGQVSTRQDISADSIIGEDAQRAQSVRAINHPAGFDATGEAVPATMSWSTDVEPTLTVSDANDAEIAQRPAGAGVQALQQVAEAVARAVPPSVLPTTPAQVIVSASVWTGTHLQHDLTDGAEGFDIGRHADATAKPAAEVTPGETQAPSLLRVHVQADGSNARVWLGVDAALGLPPEQLGQLLENIQRTLADNDIALNTLTLNGRLLYNAHRSGAAVRALSHRFPGATELEQVASDHHYF